MLSCFQENAFFSLSLVELTLFESIKSLLFLKVMTLMIFKEILSNGKIVRFHFYESEKFRYRRFRSLC